MLYTVRTTLDEKTALQRLLRKYKKLNPQLKIRDMEILIRSLKFYVEVSK